MATKRKTKTKPKLNQIEMFVRRGGNHGGGRPKGEGSTTIRIPNGLLPVVLQLLIDYRANLVSVTETKNTHLG